MRAIRTVPWMLLKFHQHWDTPQNSITPTELTTGLSAGSDQISRPLFLHIICIQAYIPRGTPPGQAYTKRKVSRNICPCTNAFCPKQVHRVRVVDGFQTNK